MKSSEVLLSRKITFWAHHLNVFVDEFHTQRYFTVASILSYVPVFRSRAVPRNPIVVWKCGMALPSSSIRRSQLCRAIVTIFLIATGVAASAGTFTTFGPKIYVRSAGNPITVTDGFTVLNPNVPFSLRVTNSRNGDGEVS